MSNRCATCDGLGWLPRPAPTGVYKCPDCREVLPATECAECKELTERIRDYEHETYTVKEALALRDEAITALRGIIEIGKRDMSNPKYDGYFESAKALLAKAKGRAE